MQTAQRSMDDTGVQRPGNEVEDAATRNEIGL